MRIYRRIKKYFKELFGYQITLDINKLPSLGLFYPKNFNITIRKPSIEEVVKFEHVYDKNDIVSSVKNIRKFVFQCTSIEGYVPYDIISMDLLFIFLKLVKLYTKVPVIVHYYDSEGVLQQIFLTEDNFNYAKIPDDLMVCYDSKERNFNFNGFRYSLPTIGVYTSLDEFVNDKVSKGMDTLEKYKNLEYNFIYCLSKRNSLTVSEIDNLIDVFNEDIEPDVKKTNEDIIAKFNTLFKYSLKNDKYVIGINNLDLTNIFTKIGRT
jgi:hypothetical protein